MQLNRKIAHLVNLKRQARHKSFSWIVLICFITGQLLAVVHQHLPGYNQSVYQASTKSPVQTVSEKCYVCDMMHHTQMAIFTDVAVAPNAVISDTQYKCQHDYIGIALILSAGRSPPRA